MIKTNNYFIYFLIIFNIQDKSLDSIICLFLKRITSYPRDFNICVLQVSLYCCFILS